MSNLSQEKRKEMLEYINKLKEIHKDDESIIALEKIETALTEKKYGLVWEEHKEEVDKKLVHNIPIFTEVEERKIIADENEGFNFLLEGDNLHSLKLLEKTHKGKIDVIYIDPPYNTGIKDFVYDDNYIGTDDGYRHSKWLSFMNERLAIAQKLLSDEGVIFISIDDNEQAQLKLLCDQIFGEENFINLISVKTKNAAGASGGGQDLKLKKNLEYLLIYSKDIKFLPEFNTVYKLTEIEELLDYYKENDISWKYTSVLVNPGTKKYIGSTVDGAGDEIKIYKRLSPIFMSVSQIAKKDNITVREVYKNYFNQIHMTAMPQSSIRKRVVDYIGENNLDKESLYSIEYIPISGRNKGRLYEQFYKGQKLRLIAWFADVGIKNSDGVFKKDIEGTYWDGIELNNLSKEGNVKFSNGKKPLSLLNRIIKMYKYKEATILDFFAGSGTTGHAVMQLNKEDGGKRKYILCTNNENKICEEVTYKRLQNIQEELPHNLKYFKTDFTPKFSADEYILSLRLLDHIKEMVELENMCEIDGENRVIILSDENLKQNIEAIKDGAYLYMPVYILLSIELKKLIEKKNIHLVKIPEYYFMDELREANEI
ncbi:MAG: site-specific DNA-methyltransferase [Fenollaria massiliensis]